MKRILLITFMLVSALVSESWAQTRSVTGTVTSAEDGSTLPGVNVILKGTTTGTVTDIDGNYRLNVPEEGGTLTYTFIGLAPQEVEIGARSVVDIQMATDVKQLSEVIVTAVGIEREARALGYSVESVGGEQISQVAEPDPLRALQGKVAGVNISGSSGAPGSATRITIRGNSSLFGNNQPLFVVDGVPYNNETNNTFAGLTQGAAYGSRIADLDPNNIESMTVLKGGAAAALYGSRAANGVVLITTKTGSTTASRKGLEITYSMSYGRENIANLPEYQNSYGAGTGFQYAAANGSWGAPFIGSQPYATRATIPHWFAGRAGFGGEYDTVSVPYQAYPDNVKDLFETGSIFENSVTIMGGNETSNLGVTVSRSQNDGYVPNTSFDRTNLSVGGRTELANKLNVGANFAYTKSEQKAVQSGVGASGANNPSAFARALHVGRNWDIHGQPYQNPSDLGSEFMIGRGQADNPLWSYENAGFRSEVDRIVASIDAGYDVLDWLNVAYKIGINSYTQNNLDFIRPGSTGPSDNPGEGLVTEDVYDFEEIESNFLITMTHDFNEDLNLRAIVGHNVNQRTTRSQAVKGLGYVIFDIDDIDNTNDVTPFGGGYEQRRLWGIYGDVTLGYRDYAYLTLTGRNDWSSTLPSENRSFFYPAITGSLILTDALNIQSNLLDFIKLRGGWSQVGSDTDPYQLQSVYLVNDVSDFLLSTLPFNGVPGVTLENTLYDPNLLPERTSEVEVGADFRFFDGRIGFNATYYYRSTTDQIAPVSLASSTGYSQYYTNFGEVTNEGLELSLDLTPVKMENGFTWNIFTTFTKNKNIVEELIEGVDQSTFGSGFAGGVITVHRPGQPYGLLLGSVAARDDEGNLLIDPANGQLITALDQAIIGDPNPDFNLGVTNTFSFKGLYLTGVLDWKQGGDLYSNTVSTMLGRGVTKDTEDREMNKIIPGVYGDPQTLEPIRTEAGAKIPNQTMIEENSLWFGNTFAINGLDEFAVWDATVVRLREITLGYSLPESVLENTPFGRVNLSFTGRNLWFHASNFPEYSNYNPEINQFTNSNQQGIEWAATPLSKRYTVNLSVTF